MPPPRASRRVSSAGSPYGRRSSGARAVALIKTLLKTRQSRYSHAKSVSQPPPPTPSTSQQRGRSSAPTAAGASPPPPPPDLAPRTSAAPAAGEPAAAARGRSRVSMGVPFQDVAVTLGTGGGEDMRQEERLAAEEAQAPLTPMSPMGRVSSIFFNSLRRRVNEEDAHSAFRMSVRSLSGARPVEWEGEEEGGATEEGGGGDPDKTKKWRALAARRHRRPPRLPHLIILRSSPRT